MADLNGKTGNKIKGLTLANLGIAGPKGEDGVGIASITMNAEYELIITLTFVILALFFLIVNGF